MCVVKVYDPISVKICVQYFKITVIVQYRETDTTVSILYISKTFNTIQCISNDRLLTQFFVISSDRTTDTNLCISTDRTTDTTQCILYWQKYWHNAVYSLLTEILTQHCIFSTDRSTDTTLCILYWQIWKLQSLYWTVSSLTSYNTQLQTAGKSLVNDEIFRS